LSFRSPEAPLLKKTGYLPNPSCLARMMAARYSSESGCYSKEKADCLL
jgi:hypothetical protein